jgi:hypothetical protein
MSFLRMLLFIRPSVIKNVLKRFKAAFVKKSLGRAKAEEVAVHLPE